MRIQDIAICLPSWFPWLAVQVRTDEDGFALEPLRPGIIMAEHYIRMQTMVLMASSPPGSTIPDLINIVAR